MSLHETPMTERCWKSVGGWLIEEFLIVERGPDGSLRRVDGLIIFGGKPKRTRGSALFGDLKGRDVIKGRNVIVVQTKARRLSMPLTGQAYCSWWILKKHYKARTVRSAAVCTADDAVLAPITKCLGIEVETDKPLGGKSKK